MAALAAIFIAQNPALADAGGTPQASINLQNCDVALCFHNDTGWTLSKDGGITYSSPGVGVVNWIITATKGVTTPNQLIVYGFLTVNNAGSGPATLGNIVINLQKQVDSTPCGGAGNKFVSAAANIANATAGDVATLANLLAAGSAEDPALNACAGPGNYAVNTVTGVGTFNESAGSGTLSFFNADDNSLWALNDPGNRNIAPGATVNLIYVATFDAATLGLTAGLPVRVEAMVTFGNAGARGGSGAVANSVDIDGDTSVCDVCNGANACNRDGVLCPEKNVRTVPCRLSLPMPPLENCNAKVHLSDTTDDIVFNSMTAGGTASVDQSIPNPYSGDVVKDLTDTGTATISLAVRGNAHGGDVCNTANLNGDSESVSLNIIKNGNPTTVSEPCCVAVSLTAQNCQTIDPEPPQGCSVCGLNLCSFTQGGWGNTPNGNNPGQLLAANFNAVYGAAGVTVGGGYTMKFNTSSTIVITKHGHTFTTNTVTVTGPEAIHLYLPAKKTPGQLTASLTNPDKSSSGVFGGQVLALQLNVDFSAAGVNPSGLGGVHLCGGDFPASVQGLTISQLLAKANAVLGGATPASQGLYALDNTTPMTVSQLNDIVDLLNQSFDNCATSDWASHHLCP
jgi:hypothetical protein